MEGKDNWLSKDYQNISQLQNSSQINFDLIRAADNVGVNYIKFNFSMLGFYAFMRFIYI